jgi:cell division protein FtsB
VGRTWLKLALQPACIGGFRMTEHDPEHIEIAEVSRPHPKRRWPRLALYVLAAVVVGLGAWQVVQLHNDVSTLQSQDRHQQAQLKSQQAKLKSQQAQLGGLNDAALNAASTTSINQIENKISVIEGVTTNLSVMIGCVNTALRDATVNGDGSLFVSIAC